MPNVSLVDGHTDEPKITNYDRIRNMSIKELADFLQHNPLYLCFYDEVLKYLESEVDTK